MNINSLRSAPLALALTLAMAAAPSAALASGFQLIEQNASGLGNAYAGQAAAAGDASTIFYNPAGMTLLKGKSLVIGGAYVGINTSFINAGSSGPFIPGIPAVPIPVPLGGLGGNAGKWTPVPNGYLSWQAADKVWVGVGVSVPFGLKTDWDPTWMGRFHAVTSDVKTININPSLAFKLNDQVSIGAGFNAQRLSATLSSGVAYGGFALAGGAQAAQRAAAALSAQTGIPVSILYPKVLAQVIQAVGINPTVEGLSTVDGDDWKYGWNLGLMVHPNDKFRMGLSYRSKISHEVKGTVTFAGAPTYNGPGSLAPLAAALNGGFASGNVSTNIDLPDTFSVAFAGQPTDKVELLGDFTWTGWDKIQGLDIFREGQTTTPLSSELLQFQNTWRAGVGVNIKANDRVTVRLGTAYDKTPVRDQYRTPRLPDNNRWWASGGLQVLVGKSGHLDIGYAHLFIKDSTSKLVFDATDPGTAFNGNLVGTYPAKVDIVGLQYAHSF